MIDFPYALLSSPGTGVKEWSVTQEKRIWRASNLVMLSCRFCRHRNGAPGIEEGTSLFCDRAPVSFGASRAAIRRPVHCSTPGNKNRGGIFPGSVIHACSNAGCDITTRRCIYKLGRIMLSLHPNRTSGFDWGVGIHCGSRFQGDCSVLRMLRTPRVLRRIVVSRLVKQGGKV